MSLIKHAGGKIVMIRRLKLGIGAEQYRLHLVVTGDLVGSLCRRQRLRCHTRGDETAAEVRIGDALADADARKERGAGLAGLVEEAPHEPVVEPVDRLLELSGVEPPTLRDHRRVGELVTGKRAVRDAPVRCGKVVAVERVAHVGHIDRVTVLPLIGVHARLGHVEAREHPVEWHVHALPLVIDDPGAQLRGRRKQVRQLAEHVALLVEAHRAPPREHILHVRATAEGIDLERVEDQVIELEDTRRLVLNPAGDHEPQFLARGGHRSREIAVHEVEPAQLIRRVAERAANPRCLVLERAGDVGAALLGRDAHDPR